MLKNRIVYLFLQRLLFFTVFLMLFCSTLKAEEVANLSNILHQLEQVSPQLKVDKASVEATQADVDKASSEYWGRIKLYGRDVHYNNARLVGPISPPVDFSKIAIDRNQYGYGANFSLPLDINGKITAKVHAQEHLTKEAHFAVENSRLQLFTQAVFLYRSLQRLTGIREALLKQQQGL